jgi:serine/threonine protein kinase
MIIQGSYFGDKADVWSTGCILLELVVGHERFCEIWMTAYDYEILQDKDKFTRCIKETTADLPGNLTFSARLNDFILQFFELRPSRRPSVSALSSHDWLNGLADVELSELESVRPQRSVSMDVLRGSLHMSSMLEMTVTTGEEDMTQGLDRRYVEEIFSNLSERERKHMEEYIVAHKNDEGLHVMHLPPIVPATPNISGAKKLLRKGHEANDFSTFYDGFSSPSSRGSLSPVPSNPGSGRASILPGVIENEVLSDPDMGPKGSAGNRSLANLARHPPIDQAKLFNSQSDRNLDRC